MKVHELIEQLKKCNEGSEVCISILDREEIQMVEITFVSLSKDAGCPVMINVDM